MTRTTPLALLILAWPTLASAHPLGETALDMEPGEWRELSTDNLASTMDTTNGGVPEYGDSAAWDPNTQSIFVHGQGHEGGTGQFRVVTFDAEANRWDALSQPGWYADYPHQISHPYDHSAVDPETGTYYMRPFSWNRVYSYDTAGQQWGELPMIPDWSEWINCCGGLVHFPELGGLVLVASGEIVAYDYAGQTWSTLGSGVPMGGYHNFAEYSAGEGAVLLGGGPGDGGDSGARVIHRLDADGTLTLLAEAPFDLGTTESVITADPVSGTFLVLTHGGVLQGYDLATDTWSVVSRDAPLPVFNTLATPISDHGVVLFANWDTGEAGTVTLFKMSPFDPPPSGDSGGEDDGDDDGEDGADDANADDGTSDDTGDDDGSGESTVGDPSMPGGSVEDGSGTATGGAADAGEDGCACRSDLDRDPRRASLVLLALVVLARRRRRPGR